MNVNRSVSDVKSELTINGSKDCFIEDIDTNYSLINKRIVKDLCCVDLTIGRYSKTKIKVLYVSSIADIRLVNNICNRLNNINIDAIIDSSYLKNSLEDEHNLFPTIIETERPDKSCMALLEGKAIIIVDNSPYVLILPNLFFDFFHTPDDYYQKAINTSFIRIIRLIAFIISIFLPGFFIAVTTRNYNLVPINVLLIFKAGRAFVPFSAFIEAMFMIISFEILKESDLRMSHAASSSISILGGLILGDAAVAAGIVSPIMIIIIAISSIAGLIFPSQELVNTIRIYKIIALIMSSLFGIYGLIMSFLTLTYNIFDTRIFGYKYLDYDKNELLDSFFKYNTKIKKRNSHLTNNKIRGKYK